MVVTRISELGLLNPYAGAGTGATLTRHGIWWGNDNATGDGLWNDSVVTVGSEADVADTTEGLGIQFRTETCTV